MGQQIEMLAQFAAATEWNMVPAAVQHHTKLVVLDTLGVMLAGAERPDAQQLRKQLASTSHAGTDGGATVLGGNWPRCDTRTAALLNGFAGRSIELCEGQRLVSTQPAIQILPGVLALGEQIKSTGSDILSAFIGGYDIAARLCTAFTARPTAHQNGQATLLAAAAAGARLSNFDGADISLAMRIATSLILTASYNNVVNGGTTLNVAGAMSSFAVALVPDLVRAGLTAQENAIEESLGQLVGSGFNPEHLADELGVRWEITRNYFRLYACCNPIHPALDALKAVLERLKPQGADIERIDIATYRFASVMRNPDPPNYFASKYSLPHAAACMVVKGGAGYAELNDAALEDPAIMALRHRVHMTEDPAMSAAVPRSKPARVTVMLRDGRKDVEEVQSHRGDFYDPFAESELRDKFRELAGVVLTTEGVDRLERAVDHLETWQSMDELLNPLRDHSRR